MMRKCVCIKKEVIAGGCKKNSLFFVAEILCFFYEDISSVIGFILFFSVFYVFLLWQYSLVVLAVSRIVGEQIYLVFFRI